MISEIDPSGGIGKGVKVLGWRLEESLILSGFEIDKENSLRGSG
jgi:hypothetical protein